MSVYDQRDQQVGTQYNVGEIHYGISLTDHKRALEEREREVIERLAETDPSDRLIREILEREYNAVIAKLNNLEQSYQDAIKTSAETEKTLKEFRDNLPQSQVDFALKKINEGDKSAAKELFDKVINQAEKTNELAGKAAYENGRIAEQEIRYLDAKEYFEKAVGFQRENTDFVSALGSMLYILGLYDTAIDYFQQALASDLKTYGEDHHDVAVYRNNLGSACHALGQYEKAIEYYQQALASDLKTYGEDHPDVASDRNNLGSAFHALGQYEKAIEYFQQALASDLKTYGEDHPKVATCRNNLGGAYYEQGNYQKALVQFNKSLKIRKIMLGEQHPDTLASNEWIQATKEKLNAIGREEE